MAALRGLPLCQTLPGSTLCCACLKQFKVEVEEGEILDITHQTTRLARHRQGFQEMDALKQALEERLLDGRLWRLRVHSPGADSLLLLFRWATGLQAWESLSKVRVIMLHGMSLQLRLDAPRSAILLDALFDDTWSVQQSRPTESCVMSDVDIVTLKLRQCC